MPQAGPLKDLAQHEETYNRSSESQQGPSGLSQVLNAPLQKPLSPEEEAACTSLVKRLMRGGRQLVLKTGDQVRYNTQNYKHKMHI